MHFSTKTLSKAISITLKQARRQKNSNVVVSCPATFNRRSLLETLDTEYYISLHLL